jgi:hypothetical protein|tara:strand:+ start:950 stop:1108 length:159 start_codon:yes stop_codon:yes gene_type:complete
LLQTQCATIGYRKPVITAVYRAYALNRNRSATAPLTMVALVAAKENAKKNRA